MKLSFTGFFLHLTLFVLPASPGTPNKALAVAGGVCFYQLEVTDLTNPKHPFVQMRNPVVLK